MTAPSSHSLLPLVTPGLQAGFDAIGRMVLGMRRSAMLTQLQLERLSGVDQTQISRLENGKAHHFRLIRLAAIVAAANGVDITDAGRQPSRILLRPCRPMPRPAPPPKRPRMRPLA